MAIIRGQKSLSSCVCIRVRAREYGGLFVSVQPHIHAILVLGVHVCESVCMYVCVVHGQRPCQKPEARLASLK